MNKIRFLIDPDGRLSTHFEGFVGETCMAEAERIARALAEQGVNLDVDSLLRTGVVDAQNPVAGHPLLRERDLG